MQAQHQDPLDELGREIKAALRWQSRLLAVSACWAACATIIAAAIAADAVAQVPPNAHRYRAELTRAAHSQWGLDAPTPVFAAQIHQESGWRADAVSRVGAKGMAQFMPATARWWCNRVGLDRADCTPTNPVWALRALVGYDKFLYDRTPDRFSAFDRWWLTLRGYNGGEGHWQAESRTTGVPLPSRHDIDAACGKSRRHVSHCPENLGYPARILGMLQQRYASWGVTIDGATGESHP